MLKKVGLKLKTNITREKKIKKNKEKKGGPFRANAASSPDGWKARWAAFITVTDFSSLAVRFREVCWLRRGSRRRHFLK